MINELDPLVESLEIEHITDEENAILEEEAIERFNSIETSKFSDMSNDVKEIITKDHETTRKILTKNINKLEKLTEVIFDKLALEQDVMSIQSATQIISEQSKSIKLLAELQNKMIANKILADKNKPKEDKGLPPGLSLED